MSLSIAMSDVSNRETKTHPSLQAGGVVIKRISPNHIERVVELTTRRIGDATAPAEVMQDVLTRNEDTFWGVFSQENGNLIGYHSFLFLSDDGHRALLARTLDTVRPPQWSMVAT